MTDPLKMNCAHSADGWCLACVAAFAARIREDERQKCANIAATYPMKERLHPDVPSEEMSNGAKMIFHWSAQNIAAAIRDQEGKL